MTDAAPTAPTEMTFQLPWGMAEMRQRIFDLEARVAQLEKPAARARKES